MAKQTSRNEYLTSVKDKLEISEAQIDAIERQLWQKLAGDDQKGEVNEGVTPNVYAILDGARNKRIEPLLNNGDLDYACLYQGKLSYAMQRAAPHIVHLEKGHPLTRKILRMGWGDSWGIFVICKPDVSMVTVRNNCRRISKVKLLNGKCVVFRYYDPRVMSTLLPTCDPIQVQQIYGQANKLVMESADAQQLKMYTAVDGEIVLKQNPI